MLGTAPVWRGALAQAHVACRDPITTKKGCCGAFACAADEDAFPLASKTIGVSGLAARYAAALFDLADERRILDEVASDLRQLRAMVQASPDLLRLIRSPILSRDEQSKGIEALADAAGLSPLVRDFLAVVARNRRLFAVPAMIEAFLAELAARRGEVTAEVLAAHAAVGLSHPAVVTAFPRHDCVCYLKSIAPLPPFRPTADFLFRKRAQGEPQGREARAASLSGAHES